MILQLTIGRLLSEMTVHRLGWMLVHSLWQFTLFALAAAAIMHLMRNRSASARYLVLVLVLAISAAAPVSTW